MHAVQISRLQRALLADLDRSRGTLILRSSVAGSRCDRTVFLDEFVLGLISVMLKERFRRWPRSTNPHLLVTQQTAADPAGPEVSSVRLRQVFMGMGLSARAVIADRILDEASYSADPIRLVRLLGISTQTAIKYVRAAHPDKFSTDPTQA